MGFYDRHILPFLLNGAMSAKPIAYQRRKVVPRAEGRVLEVGFGAGPTALTKTRRPSTACRRAATPGEKPLAWVAAETMRLPSHSSTAARTGTGRSCQ